MTLKISAPMKPESTLFWFGCEILDFFPAPQKCLLGMKPLRGKGMGWWLDIFSACLPFLGPVLSKTCNMTVKQNKKKVTDKETADMCLQVDNLLQSDCQGISPLQEIGKMRGWFQSSLWLVRCITLLNSSDVMLFRGLFPCLSVSSTHWS